jgi:hypothetical protein
VLFLENIDSIFLDGVADLNKYGCIKFYHMTDIVNKVHVPRKASLGAVVRLAVGGVLNNTIYHLTK